MPDIPDLRGWSTEDYAQGVRSCANSVTAVNTLVGLGTTTTWDKGAPISILWKEVEHLQVAIAITTWPDGTDKSTWETAVGIGSTLL